MQSQAESPPHGRALAVRRVAFGIALELELEGVDISMLVPSVGAAAVAQPPTRVRRVATAEIASRWATARPSRARELRSREGSVLLSVDADRTHGYLMRTPIHGRFLVSGDGLEILCAPLARAASSWTALLIGQLLPLVATLRGLEVFHASAVAQDGRALLFAATTGAGKTSLALRLVLAGARLLADDATPIDPRGNRLMAHPGAGALGVRPEEQRRLSRGERERLGEGRRSGGKVRYCASPISGPVPVGAMFVLRRTSTGSDVVLRRLDAVDPLLLLGSTFNLSVRTPERLHRQLDVCARMADEVPILTLDVPPAVDASALAARVRAWTETGA